MITFTDKPISPHVLTLIDEFSKTSQARLCSTPSGAFSNCGGMSVYFVKWLRRRGVRSGIIRLIKAPCYGEAHEKWMRLSHLRHDWHHHIVRLYDEEIYVDFTHRQFVPYSPYPVLADSSSWWGWEEAEESWDGLGRMCCDGVYYSQHRAP